MPDWFVGHQERLEDDGMRGGESEKRQSEAEGERMEDGIKHIQPHDRDMGRGDWTC